MICGHLRDFLPLICSPLAHGTWSFSVGSRHQRPLLGRTFWISGNQAGGQNLGPEPLITWSCELVDVGSGLDVSGELGAQE